MPTWAILVIAGIFLIFLIVVAFIYATAEDDPNVPKGDDNNV